MERVQRTVEIKLTPEECEILWKAEQLLREMEKKSLALLLRYIRVTKRKLQNACGCLEKSLPGTMFTLLLEWMEKEMIQKIHLITRENQQLHQHKTIRNDRKILEKNLLSCMNNKSNYNLEENIYEHKRSRNQMRRTRIH